MYQSDPSFDELKKFLEQCRKRGILEDARPVAHPNGKRPGIVEVKLVPEDEHWRVVEVMQVAVNAPRLNVTASTMKGLCGWGPRKFRRVFGAVTGMLPGQFVRRARKIFLAEKLKELPKKGFVVTHPFDSGQSDGSVKDPPRKGFLARQKFNLDLLDSLRGK